MKKLLLILLILSVGLSSCKKSRDKIQPLAAKGSISGVVRPSVSVTGVTASATINGQPVTYNTTIEASGAFKFPEVTEGVYMINFLPTPGYAVSSRSVTVTAGQNTDMGNINFSLAAGGISGTFSPAGLATSMIITYTSGSTYTSTFWNSVNSSGVIKAEYLQVGTYIVSFSDVPGYVTPTSQTITVTNGQTTDLGTIIFQKASAASISGTVTPASAAASITVSRMRFLFNGALPAQTYTATPDGSGHFTVAGLDAAYYYDIAVTPVAGNGLNAPNKIRIFLPSGQDVDLGSLEQTTIPPPYPLSYNQDGALINTTLITGSYAAGKLTLTQAATISGNSNNITLVLNKVTGAGDYPCNGTTGSRITLQTTYSSSDPLDWESNAPGGDGLIKITAFDQIHQTVSGTFTANLARGAIVKKITNGTFVNLHYSKP
ncbi:carboxypeptidase-like regulatory domain-containing protein [Hufsiella ginkgonis]|uniref:Carboxypeptidase regulatory-like domain-containing protein n=1 Tax=Hufsiella ginkgonis TaxID=2695274 RepID=A0A7K1Y086_9SPHI|nr:carboxypeptidase-like regulatory domain-containing protein [Hufsiella ginkgonis]MXV16640.1 hypothetical protein [Hufsiella ginkgonis]